MTALMIASRNGHVVVLDILLKHGANVDFKKEVRIYSQSVLREGGTKFEGSVSLVSFLHYPLVYTESLLPACLISLLNVYTELELI